MPTWRSRTTGHVWRTIGPAPPAATNGLAGDGPWELVPDDAAERVDWRRLGGQIQNAQIPLPVPELANPRTIRDAGFQVRFAPGNGGVWNLGQDVEITTSATESLSSRSSSEPQDPAYQIEESLESLGQELEDLEAAKEVLATQVEVLEEMSTVIRSHISTLRTVASQLRTSSPSPQSRQSKSAQFAELAQPEAAQAAQFAGAAGVAVGQQPLRLDRG